MTIIDTTATRMTAADVIERTEGATTLSTAEAAVILGVSRQALDDRARAHGNIVPGIPALQIGGRRRYPRERVLAFARGDLTVSDSVG